VCWPAWLSHFLSFPFSFSPLSLRGRGATDNTRTTLISHSTVCQSTLTDARARTELAYTIAFPVRVGLGIPSLSPPLLCSFHPDMMGTSGHLRAAEVPTLRRHYTNLLTESVRSTLLSSVTATSAAHLVTARTSVRLLAPLI